MLSLLYMASDFKKCKEESCSKQILKGMTSYCSYQCSDKSKRRRDKEKKKERPGYWMAKADTAASLYYRARTPFCEAAGKDTKICKGGLQWAHIKSRGNLRIRYEPYNHLVLCSGHHLYYTKRPSAWEIMIATEFPERWELINETWLEYANANVDYFKMYLEHFRTELKKLEP